MRLCVLHNLYFYNHMMEEIREAIEQGRYKEYKRQKLDGMEAGESKKLLPYEVNIVYNIY